MPAPCRGFVPAPPSLWLALAIAFLWSSIPWGLAWLLQLLLLRLVCLSVFLSILPSLLLVFQALWDV